MLGGLSARINLGLLAHFIICGAVAGPGILIFLGLHIMGAEPYPDLWIFGAALLALVWLLFSYTTYPVD